MCGRWFFVSKFTNSPYWCRQNSYFSSSNRRSFLWNEIFAGDYCADLFYGGYEILLSDTTIIEFKNFIDESLKENDGIYNIELKTNEDELIKIKIVLFYK